MNGNVDKAVASAEQSQERIGEIMGKLLAVAQPGSVFTAPVTAGDYTVINASEVSAGMGFGLGIGVGNGPASQGSGQSTGTGEGTGGGGGGGGGGGAMARPVAVITVGPDGVEVEPVVDVTKISIALFTALGSMFLMFGRMRRGR